MDFTSPEDGQPSPFIALVGVNGAGKTTVLEAIAQSIQLFARSRVESPFLRPGESVELILGEGRLARRRQPQFEVQLLDGAVIIERGSKYLAKQPGDPAASPYPIGTLPATYWAGRPANLERALFIRSGYVPTLPTGKLLEMGPARGMTLELALLPDSPEQRVAAVHQWWLHMHWEYPKTATLDRLWAALKPFLGNLVYAGVNPQDHLPWFDDHGTRVSFNELSSGQRRLILLFLEIFMQCGEDGLVLFDEPEAHFHPYWQQMLPDALCQLVPRGQVIVATHAPHIVDGRPAHQVFVLGELPWERSGVVQ